MNGSHLPAGQPMPAAIVGGGQPGPGPAGGRRRPPSQYASHQYHTPPHHMYNSYMNPYANTYYPPHIQPHHYQNGAMTNAPYGMPYNLYTQRSPPAMHQQYPPIVSSSMQPHPQTYSRPPPPQQQPSPAISTPPPYTTTVPPPSMPVTQTPSSTQSPQPIQTPLSPPTPKVQEVASASASAPTPAPAPVEPDVQPIRAPFKAPLPWLSRPELPFPKRIAKSKRKRRLLNPDTGTVELPANQQGGVESAAGSQEVSEPAAVETPVPKTITATEPVEPAVLSETSSTQDLPSENAQSTSPSTPTSVQPPQVPPTTSTSSTKPNKSTSRIVPTAAVPLLPVVPKSTPKDVRSSASPDAKSSEVKQTKPQEASDKPDAATVSSTDVPQIEAKPEPAPAPAPAPVKTAPKLWTGLFASSAAPSTTTAGGAGVGTASLSAVPGSSSVDDGTVSNGGVGPGGFSKSNTSSLAEALRVYNVSGSNKIAFLEPRGLINTGNMCYMNSVLQVLIFCIPFYDFLDQVSKKAAHSFKSETPLIDAMIMFMREYKAIDSAVSVDQLRRRLKNEELEQYGEPFTPEFVYDAIRKLPRFASMRRGHQQDAEEFLGFLLESLHDECVQVMQNLPDTSTTTTAVNSSTATPTAMSSPTSTTADSNDWHEVGRRQRAAITRSSGHPVASSPITKIFGGQLRSELRVTSVKDSITLEPFQPLQLDIGSPQVHNIVDALKGLTRPETLHGDFSSPRGRDAIATKQVFIESLPPVLILHLKRFQFDAEGTGTVKIWKKVGYPLELEIPKEILSRHKRNALTAEGAGFPKYRLIAAVYHHGKNASGGHYTVDLRRQDGREWIRLDDTVIRRIRSDDVAEGGVEEDTNKATTWADKKDAVSGGSGNRFEGIGNDDAGDDEGWNKVSAPINGAKKWSSVVNGGANKTATMPRAKQVKDSVKDNKVAYLLFYQKV
ncbi:hypothetical protein F5X96DRAFT_373059 [Biscogniauxia mediterranea]|nr:hypothetical protein F5X96DRAFT_373059 [Biscogniauxia mediterranea]